MAYPFDLFHLEAQMYNVIMVPTDGSGFDREAIRVALRIAEKSGAKVRLVRVVSSATMLGMAASPEAVGLSPEITFKERNAVESELDALAAECRSMSDAPIAADLLDGPVAEMLEGYAHRNDIDLIVISSHGRGGISRLALGSVTDSLIRHTKIPVLVVKMSSSYLNPQASDAFKRIVVALDGSTLAEQVLPCVSALANLEQSEVTLLHVLVPQTPWPGERSDSMPPWWDRDIAVSRAYLARIAGTLRGEGLSVVSDIMVAGNVSQAIGDYAARERADLIAIATHGRGGVARMVRGSVADAITRSSPTSMLVFRPENPAEAAGSRKHEGHALERELALP
ncbi:MAG: universal stress protein [Gemmatimonadaceae bacterium]